MGRTWKGESCDASASGMLQSSPRSQIELLGQMLLSMLSKKSDMSPCNASVFFVNDGCPKHFKMKLQSLLGARMSVMLDWFKNP